uniref:F-box/WD repeat-containing protein 4 isoform X2 n=1 Tax=Myxine glutinosa TaxID=7769 RepID=UPI00358F48FE
MRLLSLPEDVLLLILSLLEKHDLAAVACCCRRFRNLSTVDCVWRRLARSALHAPFRPGELPLKECVRISENWQAGRCSQRILLGWRDVLLPWLLLHADRLYVSQASDVVSYGLRRDGRFARRPLAIHRHPAAHHGVPKPFPDVCRFLVFDDEAVIAGCSDGTLRVHGPSGKLRALVQGHDQEISSLDTRPGVLLSGSRDHTAKVWSLAKGAVAKCLLTVPVGDRVWSVGFNPTKRGDMLGTLGVGFRHGASVMGLMYESPATLLSWGHDTYIRLWDTRVSMRHCVQRWEEPHDSALYCVQSDRNNLLVSGSAYYGVVRLWDKRQTRCLHMFSLSSPVSSPVYSLALGTAHLYAAIARYVILLDFK